MFSTSQKHQEHQPAWKWDVHADGVIFSYGLYSQETLTLTPGTNVKNQENRPSLLDYLHLSPVQIPGGTPGDH
jgi:hypothetical protein